MLPGVWYPGGKNGAGVYQKIISRMPPHSVYIEPFLGGGAILRLKRPAALNIGVDLDARVARRLRPIISELQAPAVRFGDGARGRIPSPGSAMLAASADLAESADGRGGAPVFRFKCADGIEFLRSYRFTGAELVYCDPPYMRATRSCSRDLYRFEMSDAQHVELLAVLLGLPCFVLISGYWSELYAQTLASWRVMTFNTTNRAGSRVTEWLWANFPEPVALHDYRYLGSGFRERERIKRKKSRWVARLRQMPVLERRALLVAISEAWGAGAAAAAGAASSGSVS